MISQHPVHHKHDPVGVDIKHVFDAVLDQQDGHTLVHQAAYQSEGFQCTGWVQAGQRFVQH